MITFTHIICNGAMLMDDLILQCAPLEGVTDYIFRQIHRQFFPAADTYYTPFLSPTSVHTMTNRDMRELKPENNEGIHLVPQLLGHNAQDLLWAAGVLKDMGYGEFNLNLGCPSGTVVKKKKGSGLLGDLEMLKALLDELFDSCTIDISIKTRIGMRSSDEFPAILELFDQYPIKELTIHPRVTAQQYRGCADREAFRYAETHTALPLCCNGDLFDAAVVEDFRREFPNIRSLMFGRSLISNPNLIGEVRGASPVTTLQLQEYHNALYSACRQRIGHEKPTLLHMKEMWYYLGCSFENAEKPLKAIRKAQCETDFLAAVSLLFASCPVREHAGFVPPSKF